MCNYSNYVHGNKNFEKLQGKVFEKSVLIEKGKQI